MGFISSEESEPLGQLRIKIIVWAVIPGSSEFSQFQYEIILVENKKTWVTKNIKGG